MIIRIVLGSILLLILAVLIIPKPSKTPITSTTPTTAPLRKGVIKQHAITLSQSGFDPQKITIKKGELVIFTNKSGKIGSVNSADYPTHKLFKVLNLGSFESGSSVQALIYRIGELRYVNHFNPKQTGTIIVEE